jgi:hypothetical protein
LFNTALPLPFSSRKLFFEDCLACTDVDAVATRVSWLLGSLKLVSLPYDRVALRNALLVPDVDARRHQAFQVLKSFNKKSEEKNARELANFLRCSAPAG